MSVSWMQRDRDYAGCGKLSGVRVQSDANGRWWIVDARSKVTKPKAHGPFAHPQNAMDAAPGRVRS